MQVALLRDEQLESALDIIQYRKMLAYAHKIYMNHGAHDKKYFMLKPHIFINPLVIKLQTNMKSTISN